MEGFMIGTCGIGDIYCVKYCPDLRKSTATRYIMRSGHHYWMPLRTDRMKWCKFCSIIKKLEKRRVIEVESKDDGEAERKAAPLERFRKMTKNPSSLKCLPLPVVQSVLDGVRTTEDDNVSSLDRLDGATAVGWHLSWLSFYALSVSYWVALGALTNFSRRPSDGTHPRPCRPVQWSSDSHRRQSDWMTRSTGSIHTIFSELPILLKNRLLDTIGVSNSEVNAFSMKPAFTLRELQQPRILELLQIADNDLCLEHVPIKNFQNWTFENPELEDNKCIRPEVPKTVGTLPGTSSKISDAFAKLNGSRFPTIFCETGWMEGWEDLMEDTCLWLLCTKGQTKIIIVLSFDKPKSRSNPVRESQSENNTTDGSSKTKEQTTINTLDQSTCQTDLAQILEQLNQQAKLQNP
ncbi:hypothetical protein HOY82DRAFT_671478 [Tuber indicum]|nr:hypothetical protein HOY82DRAFT_671478 [Tuber indicum]